jgi:hypothetical protein
MNANTASRTLRVVVSAACLCMAAAVAQTKVPLDRDQLERKFTSTATLIESSSGAKQIEASGNADATGRRARARELHAKAGEALKAGDLATASKMLDDSSRALFEAVRLAAPAQVVESKERTDYQARMDSTRALLDAQKRIAAEKGPAARGSETSRQVEGMIAEAERQAQAGRLPDAKRTIDQAYLTVKAAIGTMRGGETVVRSLNFATPAEEYAYEIDRNDTHRMLVQMLLKDKRGGSLDAMVDQAVGAAAQLRTRAEAEAARREHPAAIKTLEDSTRELVKAIRAAGVYIPG